MSAEEVFTFVGVLRGFGCVDRHPTDAFRVELGPTVITGDLALAAIGREREPDCKPRGNAHRTGISDEDRVEIGAISAALLASEIYVAAPPALSGLVVLDGRNHVIVDRLRHLQIRVGVRRIDHFTRPFADLVVKRNQAVRLQPSHQLLGVLVPRQPRAVIQAGLTMLFARRVDLNEDREGGFFRILDPHVQNLVALGARFDLVLVWRLDMKIRNLLVRFVVRNGYPEIHVARAGRDVFNGCLVGEGEAAAAHSRRRCRGETRDRENGRGRKKDACQRRSSRAHRYMVQRCPPLMLARIRR